MKKTKEQAREYYLKTREHQIARSKEYYRKNRARIVQELRDFRQKFKGPKVPKDS